ncbi:hypothetical protein FACS1894139_13380 [Planctomycetales bacterium]|nr:hypothetical protein FACS1894107_09590 [Planctomycetales bacterium]GHT06764.1 hypothetical protein FACS1894139_13380 [Planctomycetales bacterium]
MTRSDLKNQSPLIALKARNTSAYGKRRRSISRATIGKDGASAPTEIGRFAAFWRTALAAGGGVCRLTAGLSDYFYQSTAIQGGGAKNVRLTLG